MLALQIAHIYGLKPNSARYLRSLTDAERNAFANMIFLCFPHHRIVDKYEDDYPPELLLSWKSSRETPGQAQLRGLRDLTEDRLESMIQEAYAERDGRITDALDRLEAQGDNAAEVIRELLAEISNLRGGSRPLLDADLVAILDEASRRLVHLPDSATIVNRAADRLAGLQDLATSLSQTAEQLCRAQGNM